MLSVTWNLYFSIDNENVFLGVIKFCSLTFCRSIRCDRCGLVWSYAKASKRTTRAWGCTLKIHAWSHYAENWDL